MLYFIFAELCNALHAMNFQFIKSIVVQACKNQNPIKASFLKQNVLKASFDKRKFGTKTYLFFNFTIEILPNKICDNANFWLKFSFRICEAF